MKLLAIRKLVGADYRVEKGRIFEVKDREQSDYLIREGLARIPDIPRVMYQTKVIRPAAPEVVAGTFRDVHLPDQGQAAVPAASDPVLSSANTPQPGVTDSRRRRRGR